MNSLFFKVWRNLIVNNNIFRYVYLYKKNRVLLVYKNLLNNIEIDYAFKLIINVNIISLSLTNIRSIHILDLKNTMVKNFLIKSDKIETIILPNTANLKLIKYLPKSTKSLSFFIEIENNGSEYIKNRKKKIFKKNNTIEKIQLSFNTGCFSPIFKNNFIPPKLKELEIGTPDIYNTLPVRIKKNSFPKSLEKLIIVKPLSKYFNSNRLKLKVGVSFSNFFPSSLLKLNIFVENFFKYYKSFHYIPSLLNFNRFILKNDLNQYKSQNINNNNNNNNSLLKSIFPDNLIKLNIQWTFENDLLFLPKSLTSLSFLNSDRNDFEIKTAFNTFKELIETNKLPQTLKKLKLSYKDIYLKIKNDKIDFSNLPKSLEKLYFYDYKKPKTDSCFSHYHKKPKFQGKIYQYINSDANILGFKQNQTHINYLEISELCFIK
ncbi:hypothetical protein ACTFIR_011013 [Dictyostelium discoideum]